MTKGLRVYKYSLRIKIIFVFILFCVFQVSCSNLRDDFYEKYDDISYIKSEADMKYPGLDISSDNDGKIWISNSVDVVRIKELSERFIKDINEEYKSIYKTPLKQENSRIILCYANKYEDLKNICMAVMNIEPTGMYGFNVYGNRIFKGKEVLCSFIGFSADVASGSGSHELVHLLNKLNLKYLPYSLDEGLVQCVILNTITPTYTTKDGKTFSFYSYVIAEQIKIYGDLSIGNILKASNNNHSNGTWILGLLLRYAKTEQKLSLLIDQCEKRMDLNEKIFEKTFGKNTEEINKDFEDWLLKEKYLDLALKL
ncbi:MAG: hypothetical protein A2231_01725 [Candidatus Firestonebacteria bacterium RIFOXYA2_FULL_40_8]|nr:MAG: hypothetical protein A2231_01725 [Candidatus Firestonebacteria bacterium RIFOXYA2_FULL_40_8]